MTRPTWPLLLALASAAIACGDNDDARVADGIFGDLGEIMPSATAEQRTTFLRGFEVATRRFSTDTGLGPHFNVTFCVSCHERPTFGGSAPRYRNFLLVGQKLADGSFTPTAVNGVQPQYTAIPPSRFASDDDTNVMATRNAIPFFGVGLLAQIPESEILSRVDEDDADGDGISGRANVDRGFVGRFGRKSQSVAIESFIRGPLFNHLGITTNPLPDSRRERLPVGSGGTDGAARGRGAARPSTVGPGIGALVQFQVGAPDEPNSDLDGVADPELSENDLFDLVSYSMLLAAPRPDEPTEESERGRKLFAEANCSGCHVPVLRSPRGGIPAFTDLLIHDMGPELADGIPMGVATGSEFRTAPLWGVAATGPWLHDGRADTLDHAIRLHGGEAEAARSAYEDMSDDERGAVLAFLRSLGGASQESPGLLPAGEPVPAPGEYGGPGPMLASADLDRFIRGRALFDANIPLGSGLGPFFNGDSCRACHFEPVIGGAGPAGVDVTRQGIIDFEGPTFTAPMMGTMAHHQAAAFDARAPIDPASNFFERRQTPPIFGLGLIEAIPRATIEALADPDDLDTDGISGRAHILPGDRLGRLGWKADVPSLAEFARDAMSAELGVTVPPQPGLMLGRATDDDDIADPEISAEVLDDIVFFMRTLAPPPRVRSRPGMEDRGELLFTSIGCADCHVPELRTADDRPVPLYSDLLLHDVAADNAVGIESLDAGMREFRTAPLWGLTATGPYMHDGRAPTIEDAILAHDTEAAKSRDAFLDLAGDAREALLAFLHSL